MDLKTKQKQNTLPVHNEILYKIVKRILKKKNACAQWNFIQNTSIFIEEIHFQTAAIFCQLWCVPAEFIGGHIKM